MDIRKLPSIVVRIHWPPVPQRRSSLSSWALGAGIIGAAAVVAYAVQLVRSKLEDATMHHRHHHDPADES